MVTALIVSPGQHPQITQLCDDRSFLDFSVSRGIDFMCSAVVIPFEKDIAIIYAQESVLLSLPGNRRVDDRVIAGTFYVVGVKDGKLRSLTDAEIIKYTSQFWEPELISEDEILGSYLDHILDPL
jgi:hypothetical protein